jgi:hypothetical protein
VRSFLKGGWACLLTCPERLRLYLKKVSCLWFSPISSVIFLFACFVANTQIVTAQSASVDAWRDCQSSDENKRLVGCTLVIKANGFGSSSKLADALDGRCWAYHVKKRFAQAIEDCKASIRIRPKYSYVYNNLGTAYTGLGNFEEAIKAFNTAVDLKPDFYWSRVKRAEALAAVGRTESAAEDYEYLLKRDPTNQDIKNKLDALTSIPHADLTPANSAQIQCFVADPTGTPLNVRTAPNGEVISTLQNGVFVSVVDRNVDRNQKQWLYVSDRAGRRLGWVFGEFIKCSDGPPPVRPSDVTLTDSDSLSIKMEKEGGVYIVPVRFNDTITLSAIVDSGASDVSVPADVVSTLIRTKTITDQDFLGQQTYVLADGSKVPSARFRIRSMKVGNKTVEDVIASVASANGAILLGQSFLNRFKTWSVDNEQHTLTLR